ncbi:MAG TPA: hypothetical protein VEL77_01985 [Rugosimonospora sp.]|nr:hypothetical protein [Rugosimonospora sp.]
MNEPAFDLRDKSARKLSTSPCISSEKRLKRTELRAIIGEETVRLCLATCGQGLRAIVLTGSLARDEATFVEEDSGWQLLGDADFFLVYEQTSRLPSDGDLVSLISAIEDSLLARGIYGQIGLGAVQPTYLRHLKPRIATYELRTCGRVLWGDARILSLIPSFSVGEISREDAWRMLCNRTIEFLGHAAESPLGEAESSSSFRYAAIKLILDAATSYLVFAGAYEPGFRRRAVRLCELAGESAAISAAPFSLKQFAEQVSACTAWKISDSEKGCDLRPAVWKEAVRHACALWRWELVQLTGAPANLSEDALWTRWVSRLTAPQTARGWLSLARRRGWSKSWRRWPRWVGLSRRGTPRYAMYRVAAGLLSRLSDSAEMDGTPFRLGSNWGELRALLPERVPASVGLEDSWQKLAADLSWNYKSFLLGTDA